MDAALSPAPPAAETSPPSRPAAGGRALRLILLILLVIACAFVVYRFAFRPGAPSPASQPAETSSDRPIRYWTCSMHPQINRPQKGKCPICFMDLVPVYETGLGGKTEGPVLVLSDAARALAEVETSPVEYRPLSVTVRMVGKIDFDETRLAHVSAWIPGRIDKLYVNYVGIRVAKGDHLTYVYSPDLRTAQEEFLIAFRRWQNAVRAENPDEIASSLAVKDATRKKLELWGILPEQIQALESTGQPDDHMTIYAPTGGTVIAREAFEGKYLEAGERLFTIADLSSVWALLDAYEIDIPWVRYGQTVAFESDAFPGETFLGRVAFIQPVLNEMTRTIRVRVNIPNPGERLKPGMFVRARLEVALDEASRVREGDLAGKWMCPMHPEVVKDAPGSCDICGMTLVTTASLGFGPPEAPARMVPSIPVTAPLVTGERAVVYVEERSDAGVSYVGRQITLGPRAGDYYPVFAGLKEGERVVTRGNFKIDSALQIQAKPSMMKPEGGPPPSPSAGDHGAHQ